MTFLEEEDDESDAHKAAADEAEHSARTLRNATNDNQNEGHETQDEDEKSHHA